MTNLVTLNWKAYIQTQTGTTHAAGANALPLYRVSGFVMGDIWSPDIKLGQASVLGGSGIDDGRFFLELHLPKYQASGYDKHAKTGYHVDLDWPITVPLHTVARNIGITFQKEIIARLDNLHCIGF